MISKSISLMIILFAFFINDALSQSKGGRWQFENNGDDTAIWDGFNNRGDLQGGATFSQILKAPEGYTYLWLDSAIVHDYFKVDDRDDLDFENENVGISMWIYPIILNDVHFLINKGTQTDASKSTNYALRISLSKKIEFLIRDSNNKAQTATSSFTVPINQWTFVAAFYDFAVGKVYFYNQQSIQPIDSVIFKFNYLANDGPLSIGSWYRNDPQAPSIKDFQGGIDDVRISGRREDLFPSITKIEQMVRPRNEISKEYRLYPNPVRQSSATGITVDHIGPQPSLSNLKIYNLRGQLVYTASFSADTHIWNLCDQRGLMVPSGIYLMQLHGARGFFQQQVTILK